MSCPCRHIMVVLYCLFCSGCTNPIAFYVCPVPAVLPLLCRPGFPAQAVLPLLSCSCRPLFSFLFWLYFSECLFRRPCPGCPFIVVFSGVPVRAFPVLCPKLFITCPTCPVPTVLYWLSWLLSYPGFLRVVLTWLINN
jgi:hypothetical protein